MLIKYQCLNPVASKPCGLGRLEPIFLFFLYSKNEPTGCLKKRTHCIKKQVHWLYKKRAHPTPLPTPNGSVKWNESIEFIIHDRLGVRVSILTYHFNALTVTLHCWPLCAMLCLGTCTSISFLSCQILQIFIFTIIKNNNKVFYVIIDWK